MSNDKPPDSATAQPVAAFSFAHEIDTYLQRIDALRRIVGPLMRALSETRTDRFAHLQEFAAAHGIEERKKPTSSSFDVPTHLQRQWDRIAILHKDAGVALRLLPETFLVTAVSQYDAYLGRLIAGMYAARPEMLGASEKSLTYSELMRFQSFDEAKHWVIEKDVESVLRKSHSEQFDALESRLGIPLRKGLDVWPQFIEITERRNLLVHCDGVVSSQYLDVCRRHGAPIPATAKSGERLSEDASYHRNAMDVLWEIGFKLGQVMWRKLIPGELDDADSHVNAVGLDLLARGRNKVAIMLFDFALNKLPRRASAYTEMLFRFNLAQAYKWDSQDDKCDELLVGLCEEILDTKFKLGLAVLNEEYEVACGLMEQIGPKGDLSAGEYLQWPIFQRFRETPEFEACFQKVFGADHGGKMLATIRKIEEADAASSVPIAAEISSAPPQSALPAGNSADPPIKIAETLSETKPHQEQAPD